MKARYPKPKHTQSGFALFMGLIFLLMITLVAVTAMRGTSLELSMANNTANHEEAFEGAESGRMATVRILRDHIACSYAWSTGTPFTGGGTSCRPTCENGGGGSAGGSTTAGVNYPWEPRLLVDDMVNSALDKRQPSELANDPSTYVNRFTARFGPANAGTVHVGTYEVDTVIDRGSGSLQMNAYEGASGSSAQGGGAKYIDVVAEGESSQARANAAGHYRLLLREAGPGSCLTDATYGPS